jgi:hypothetical protein
MLCSGCGRPAQEASKPTPVSESKAVASSATNESEAAAVAGPDQKSCFACKGEGTVACRVPGCRNGKVECPGACLRLTRGTWVHLNMPGHDPKDVWQKFPDSTGKGSQAWNQQHVGEVIVMQNGRAANIGACKVCGGTTKVDCRACKGQGKQTCEVCEGKKFIPIAWTATDNPWFNQQPDVIRLKDGSALLGKVVLSSGEEWTVRLRDGKFTHVKGADVVAKPEASSTASPK